MDWERCQYNSCSWAALAILGRLLWNLLYSAGDKVVTLPLNVSLDLGLSVGCDTTWRIVNTHRSWSRGIQGHKVLETLGHETMVASSTSRERERALRSHSVEEECKW